MCVGYRPEDHCLLNGVFASRDNPPVSSHKNLLLYHKTTKYTLVCLDEGTAFQNGRKVALSMIGADGSSKRGGSHEYLRMSA